MNKIKYLLLFALCLCFTSVAAQDRISGHVWNKTDGPVIMANVVEVDQNNRIVENTQTDVNGNFSMPVKNRKNRLEISYIGYAKYSQVIGATKVFRIELRSKTQLKTVTVTAKQRVKSNGLSIPKKEISGATQELNMDEMKGLSFETADQALQGQIAGLDIVMNSGNLGSGTTMRLRGVTSINGNQEPLIVVDGNILENYNSSDIDLQDMDNSEQFAQLLSVNPEDIQSINVLKDAAATAIWGARGANGVIEIKTRRGHRGPARVDFSYRFSGSWQPKGMKMLNGDEYTMMLKEAYFNPSQSNIASDIVEISYDRNRPMYFGNFNKNTDWRDEVTQFGQTHNYNVVLSGGGDKAQFRISGSYDHETGTVIKQALDRFSTRMALDYYVSDRIKFSSNFSLTYTNNKKNYVGILDRAYKAMPNMTVYRYEYDPETRGYYNTHEYFKMFPAASAAGQVRDGLSSYYLGDMVSNGNPVAIANGSWIKESTYTIDPQFQIEYKFLGKDENATQLNYTGEVYMKAYTNTNKAYYPASLTSSHWYDSDGVNLASDGESKSLTFTTRHTLVFTPKFKTDDHFLTTMARMEMSTSSSDNQNISSNGLAGGITDPSVLAYLTGASTGVGKGHSIGILGSVHYSYKSKYVADFTLRADGSTRFGADNRWGFFPGVSGRWNISDEVFMKPLKKIVNLLAFRPGWGINGNQPNEEGLMYNTYSSIGSYIGQTAIAPQNLRLTDLKWEKTSAWNLGFNLNMLEDLLQFDLNVYHKYTKDLLMQNVRIPSSVGFSTLAWANVGKMENKGWELNFVTKKIDILPKKFQIVGKFNIAQNVNEITQMDASVLSSLNGDFNYNNETWMSRVQIGNALGGIYGFRYKGVYRFDYDHSGYFADQSKNTIYGERTAAYAEKYGLNGSFNATCPVARDANGNIIYDAKGNPLQMYYNYGGRNYTFGGGDAIYEDINHDGQINELDMVYLGSSNPKLNGGFGIDLYYKRWSLKTSFNFRYGNKIVNLARMQAEDMRTNRNQSTATRWRWRKNGDITTIPRAMNENAGTSYNALCSDRYVEPGDYIRFQYMQLAYDFDSKKLKRYGLRSLRFALSGNNLIFWSRYSGVDPEHSQSGWSPCFDSSQTPRSRSFTFSVNVGF